jgi:hypothetical protein
VSHARTVRSLAACGVLLAAGAAGCTDTSARPKPLPSPSPSSAVASPTPSPSATPPSLPAEARGTSAAAAKAFVRYWVEVLNASAMSGRSASLRAASSKGCVGCLAIADFIDQVRERGGAIRGDGWDVRSVRVIDESEPGYVIDALVNVRPQTVVERRGAEPRRFNGGRRLKTFWVGRADDRWKITRLDQPE